MRLLVTEASGHIGPPRRYLSPRGQFLEHSPYCERDLRGPGEPLLVEGEEVEVLVRHRQGWTRFTYAHHPFDVVGWDGCLYPYVFSIHDFEPITGRLHQPPPVHQTFEGPNFVICSFVPRLFDYHPESIPAPYNHANVDSDEVIFYVGGDFMSRKGAGIELGSLTLHPSGFTHGPQPGSVEASIGAKATEELAVMLDTFRPLDLAPAWSEGEDPAYPWTWARRSGAGRRRERHHLRLRLTVPSSRRRARNRVQIRTKGCARSPIRVKVGQRPSDDQGVRLACCGAVPQTRRRSPGGWQHPTDDPTARDLGPRDDAPRRPGRCRPSGRGRHEEPGPSAEPANPRQWVDAVLDPRLLLGVVRGQRRALR